MKNQQLSMKKKLLLLSFLLLSIVVHAQQKEATQLSKDSMTDPVLKELQEIKKLHENAQQDIKKTWAKMQANEVEVKNIPNNEYGAILAVEKNTRQHWYSDNWNLFGIITSIIAFAALIYSILTYNAQLQTEKNTKNISQDAQRHLLCELLRHLYRNYVITYTMRTKMENMNYKAYPSEEHFVKLKIPTENIHLEAFYGENEKFQLLHVLYLNFRNYNNEVEIALKHITDPNISKDTKNDDFAMLEFKISFLTGKIIQTIYDVWGKEDKIRNEMRNAIRISLSGQTNANDNIDVPNSDDFIHLTLSDLKNTSYTKLYSNEELEKVLDTFNEDVHEERKRNARGAWKVRMIEFQYDESKRNASKRHSPKKQK